YELLLSRLKSAPVENRRFVFISAIIPNISTINEWLGGNSDTLITSDYRPTELEFAFLERRGKGNTYDLNVNPLKAQPENYKLYRFLTPTELKYINPENEKETAITSKKGITTAVALKSVALGSVAVFCPEKRGNSGVEAVAEEILKQLEQTTSAVSPVQWTKENVITKLHDYFVFLFGEDYLLSNLVLAGALFHHGDLPQNVREVIEETLRKSEIRLVVCTNTLAEGVNLPIRTMIIHSSDRFDSGLKRRVPLKIRDLKNLVGRAGRAGKETSGLILIPHASDFSTMRSVIRENNVEEVNGWLYELISRITRVLQQKGIELSNEVLDSQDDQFLQWLDSIDLALIDLLAEDIETDQLEIQVQELIQQTLSYSQSNDEQKETLNQIFMLRSEKLQDYINEGRFEVIKNSGSTIRSFELITESFDLDNEIWEQDFSTFDEGWIKYLFTDGIFELDSFNNALGQFNEFNKCSLSEVDLLNIMKDWMSGKWYYEIKQSYEIEMYQLLRLINNFISFQVQNMVSSVVRIKMQVSEQYTPSNTIINWPLYLQNGISTNQELALFELGLNDRVIVLEVNALLNERGFEYTNFNDLQDYLLTNENELLANLRDTIPAILIPRISRTFNLIRLNIF
ncbi:MAG: helicase-related protein, partial [Cyclobacteriaceae bacterium]